MKQASDGEPEPSLDEATGRGLPIRYTIAFVYFHFGVLKLYPDLSAAEMLSTQTMMRLGLGADPRLLLLLLGLFEMAIALALVLRSPMKWVFPFLILHLLGTAAPLLLFPELCFKIAPFAPTLEGQYILKNAVFFAASWTLLVIERQNSADTQGSTP